MSLYESRELVDLFNRYPQLRTQLEKIHTATLEPLQDLQADETSGQGRFDRVRGRGTGWGRGQGSGGAIPWTQERGVRTGLSLLKKSRDEDTPNAEGIREFCDLALRLSPAGSPKGP